MKVAICGSGPLAIEMVLLLNNLGAEAYLFVKPNLEFGLGGQIRKLYHSAPDMPMELEFQLISSELGRTLSQCEIKLDQKVSIQKYVECYLEKLIKISYEKQLIKIGEVSRIQKRFLAPRENPKDNSRLIDLFRLVYKTIPSKEVDSTIIENREVLKGLDEKLFESLKSGFERFEDFDLIVDATGNLGESLPMGPSHSFALNELQLTVDEETNPGILYGYQGIVKKEQLLIDTKKIAIVGSGLTSARTLLSYADFLKDQSHQLTIITEEERPFARLFAERENPILLNDLNQFFEEQEKQYQLQIEKFEEDILVWKSLEDHIKAKAPRPVEPNARFDIQNGANVTSVDRLLDRKGLFLTIETPEFRKEKAFFDMKTFQVDNVLVCTGYRANSSIDLNCFSKEEPGLYQLGINESGETECLNQGIQKTERILKNMLTYFSKVEENNLEK
jgi:hypothetical protein